MKKMYNGRFMGNVSVGPKGQIVIPKEVRDMFGISPGDNLILLADVERGIAIEKPEAFDEIISAVFNGRAKEVYPNQSESDSLMFASSLKEVMEDSSESD